MEGVESSEVLMDIVKGSGYDFSREELRSAMVSLANLSDADLASVSGGSSAPSDIYMNILSLVEKF
jgi:predicted ribosomally synthesized peptide with nif11-like leader